MATSWETLAARPDCIYAVEDFETAGYLLITSQVLYESEAQQRMAYQIVSTYRTQYKERLSDLGMNFDIDEGNRFCYAVPKKPPRTTLPLQETLLILTLRSIYDVHANKVALVGSTAQVTIEELISSYRELTGRELPTSVGELRDLLQTMRRYGLAKAIDAPEGDPQPFVIAILPAIDALINESWLTRLSAYREVPSTDETEETEGAHEEA